MRWFPCETRVSVWSPPWRPWHLPASPVSRGGEAQPSPPATVRTFPFSVGASQKQAELELEIARRRALGTAVTVESFLAWRAAFDAEMAAKHGPRDEDEYLGKPSGVCSFCVWEGPLITPVIPRLLPRLPWVELALYPSSAALASPSGRQLFEQGKASIAAGE